MTTKTSMQRVAMLFVMFALGCVPRARVASELLDVPAGSARICVIRPEETAALVTMTLRDNGRLVGATRDRTYTCWLGAPGEHQITTDADDTGPTLLYAAPGGRYFLHLEVGDVGTTHAHLDFVDEHTAAEMIDACDSRVFLSAEGHEDALPIAAGR